ncbi:DUF397 domain-containing protein [Streptomyces sp. NPDC058257]|uniref:DUF397 domain-containing protein n=1 Tax=Streptomyces sp. NPDC058257 TaxID=3346409 RepID=UPI0036ED5B36
MSQHRRPLPDLTKASWRTSSYSGGQGDCVQIAHAIPHLTPIRDSKQPPTAPVICFGHDAWRAFLAHLR